MSRSGVIEPRVLVLLDGLSGLLLIVAVAFFLRLWHASRDPRHALFALGFFLIGASYPAVSASELGLVRAVDVAEAVRFAAQLGGALVIALAYVSVRRHGRARPLQVLLGALILALVAAAVVIALPPAGSIRPYYPAAHGALILAYSVCGGFALESVFRRATMDRLLVPGAFLAWGLSHYTSLMSALAGSIDLLGFVYAWRLTAIGLLLAALLLPPRRPHPEAP